MSRAIALPGLKFAPPHTAGPARWRPRAWLAARDLAAARPKRLNLALQGGGAHGAFTWGVIDRLLEDGRIEIGSISGSSVDLAA